MRAYKGFKQDMTCRGFQFEEGKTYEEPEAALCNKGFHACEYPLDCFRYYPPAESVYHEVELDGVDEKCEGDTKVAGKKITIGARLSIGSLVQASVQYIMERIDKSKKQHLMKGNRSAATNTGNWSAATNTGNQSAATNTGDWSAATNTGNQSAATNTGDWSAATNTGNWSAATNTGYWSAATNTGNWSAATNTGDQSAATVSGKESIALAMGVESKARGALGCWIVLAEWVEQEGEWHITDVKCARVDGEKIKADTWYQLNGGAFVEVE